MEAGRILKWWCSIGRFNGSQMGNNIGPAGVVHENRDFGPRHRPKYSQDASHTVVGVSYSVIQQRDNVWLADLNIYKLTHGPQY